MSGGNVAEKFPGGDISQGGVIFLHCRSVREGPGGCPYSHIRIQVCTCSGCHLPHHG